MQTLARDLGPRGLVPLAVNFEEDAATVAAFAHETGRQYGVTALPVTFFIDRRGTLIGSALGLRDWAAPGARTYLQGLLPPPG